MPVTPASARRGKPRLGQHILRDEGVSAKIVDALGDVSQRTVLEIGPGPGTLTYLLAKRARRLIAVELDRVLAAQLSMNLATAPNVEVIEADILSIDFGTLFAASPGMSRPGLQVVPERVHVVGNLPYYITSDILLHLFDSYEHFDRIVIMVQKEVADRLAAKPGTRDYGLLTDTAQLHARIEKLFDVPPGAFSPPPKVHSSVLRLTMEKKAERLGVGRAEFTSFLKLAFGQKRKTLWNNLKPRYDGALLRKALASSGIQPTVRAEALALDQKATLFRALQTGRS